MALAYRGDFWACSPRDNVVDALKEAFSDGAYYGELYKAPCDGKVFAAQEDADWMIPEPYCPTSLAKYSIDEGAFTALLWTVAGEFTIDLSGGDFRMVATKNIGWEIVGQEFHHGVLYVVLQGAVSGLYGFMTVGITDGLYHNTIFGDAPGDAPVNHVDKDLQDVFLKILGQDEIEITVEHLKKFKRALAHAQRIMLGEDEFTEYNRLVKELELSGIYNFDEEDSKIVGEKWD